MDEVVLLESAADPSIRNSSFWFVVVLFSLVAMFVFCFFCSIVILFSFSGCFNCVGQPFYFIHSCVFVIYILF